MERHGDSSHRLAATMRSIVFNALYVQIGDAQRHFFERNVF